MNNGGDQLAKLVKSWALEAQYYAVGETRPFKPTPGDVMLGHLWPTLRFEVSREGLATLASMGRALPNPSDEVIKKTLNEHRKVLMSRPVPTNPVLLKALSTFVHTNVRGMVQEQLKRDENFNPSRPSFLPIFSTSSCIEKTRKEGGCAAALAEIEAKMRADPSGDFGSSSPAEVKADVLEFAWKAEPQFLPPKGVVMAVPAPGGKARVLAKHRSEHTTMAQYINGTLIALLKNWAPAAGALHGRSITKTLRFASRKQPLDPEALVFSGDWSTSTDYIPFDVARCIADAICAELGWDWTLTNAMRRLTGCYQLRYPDGKLIVTGRGQLMGVGTSWPILSLLNGFCAEHGASQIAKRSYRICGDDILSVWTTPEIDRYRQMMEACGVKLNDRKTLIARNFGVFTEEYVELIRSGGVLPISKKDWADIADFEGEEPLPAQGEQLKKGTPLGFRILKRALLSTVVMARAADVNGRLRDTDLPRFATVGDASGCIRGMHLKPWLESRAILALSSLNQKAINTLHQAGIPPFWPKTLGGGGVHTRKPKAPDSINCRCQWLVSGSGDRFTERSAHEMRRMLSLWRPTTTNPGLNSLIRATDELVDALPRANSNGRAPLREEVRKKVLASTLAEAALDTSLRTPGYRVLKATNIGRAARRILNSWPRRANAMNTKHLVARVEEILCASDRVKGKESALLQDYLRPERVSLFATSLFDAKLAGPDRLYPERPKPLSIKEKVVLASSCVREPSPPAPEPNPAPSLEKVPAHTPLLPCVAERGAVKRPDSPTAKQTRGAVKRPVASASHPRKGVSTNPSEERRAPRTIRHDELNRLSSQIGVPLEEVVRRIGIDYDDLLRRVWGGSQPRR
jgi:hypothetical protein